MLSSYQKRFAFIEVMLTWQGRINAPHLQKHFQISRQAASKTFSRYSAIHPLHIVYDKYLKAFKVDRKFSCHYADQDISTYQRVVNSTVSLGFSPITDLVIPTRNPNPRITQPIMRAIDNNQAIDIGYTSLASPDYIDRIIEPHSLIFDGLRWHVRAFCRKNMAFRDFVLSRFNGEAVDEGQALQDPNSDSLWHMSVTLFIQPDPRLTAEQQQMIIDDYQMQQGILAIPTRAALVNYLLKRLHLDSYQVDPCAQQIVLTAECAEAIKPYRY